MTRPAEILDSAWSLARVPGLAGFPEPRALAILEAAPLVRDAAAVLLREAVKQCNGIQRYDAKARGVFASWTEADESKSERARDKAKAKALDAIRGAFGDNAAALEIEFQADPRGAMVKIWPKGQRDRGTPLAVF